MNTFNIKYDRSKLCIITDNQDNIYAWAEPYIVNGEIRPSIGPPDGSETIIIDKAELPNDILLEDCKYINGQVVYSAERVNDKQLADLRSKREQELLKYDKYQLPYVQATLTTEQVEEYNAWRQAWLDVTETKIIPDKPEWFD